MEGSPRKDEKFFRIFVEMGRLIEEAAQALSRIVADPAADPQAEASRVRELEQVGDELTHRISAELNRTFITPLDREDIHELAVALDDVLDVIDATAGKILLFRLHDRIGEAAGLTEILRGQGRQISGAVSNLDDKEAVSRHCIEINRLENEADRLYQAAIGRLFDEVTDAIEVIKRKEIIEMLETATDRAEDVADVLETIIVRSS